jgi:hypothetical protein
MPWIDIFGRNHERTAAEADHRGLERRQCAQRWAQEQQRQHLAFEGPRLGVRLQTSATSVQQFEDGVRLEFSKVRESVS